MFLGRGSIEGINCVKHGIKSSKDFKFSKKDPKLSISVLEKMFKELLIELISSEKHDGFDIMPLQAGRA